MALDEPAGWTDEELAELARERELEQAAEEEEPPCIPSTS